MTKPIHKIILTAWTLALLCVPVVCAGTTRVDAQPVSITVTPGSYTGGRVDGGPVSVIVTPASYGFATGGRVDGGSVSVIVTPASYGFATGGRVDGGSVSVTVTPESYSGNRVDGGPVSVMVELDVTQPTGSLTINNGAAFTNNTSVTLKPSATDSGSGVSRMQFSNDNINWSEWEPYSTSKSWTLPEGDGPKTVWVMFEDASGNVSDAYSSSITIDTTQPSSIITAPADNALVGGSSCTVTGTATDTGSGVQKVEVSTNGGATWHTATGTTDWSYAWTLSASGSFNLESRATDKANNVEPPGSGITVMVDKAPPVSTITTPADGTVLKGTSFTITGTADDGTGLGVQKVEVSTNGGTSWATATGTAAWGYNWSPSKDGNYTIKSRATDNNNNIESPGAGVKVTVDNTAPAISTTTPTNGGLVASVSSVEITLADSGSTPDYNGSITGATVKQGANVVDGDWFVPMSNDSLVFTPKDPFAETSYTVTLYPVDALGNRAVTASTFSFTLDATPPTVQLSMSPTSPHKAEQVTFTLTFSENMNTAVMPVVGFGQSSPFNAFMFPAGSWLDAKRYSVSYTFDQAVPDGSYTLQVSGAKDVADNVMATTQPASFLLDKTPPAVPTVNDIASPTNVSTLALSGTKEPGCSLLINGKECVPADNSGVWTYKYLLVEGTNVLNIISRDAAGNDSAPIIPAPQVSLDTAPPYFTVSYLSPSTGTTQVLTGQKDAGCVLKLKFNQTETTLADGTDTSSTWSYSVTLTDGMTNTLVFTATDALGNTMTRTIDILCDTSPPPALGVGVLQANGSGSGTTVALDWASYNESLVPDLAYYKVYMSLTNITDVTGITPVGTANKGKKSFIVGDLITGRTEPYYFAVAPVDQGGNFDNAVNCTNASPTDTQAPDDVTNLKASCDYDGTAGSNYAALTWTASADTAGDLASQKLYFDGGSGYDAVDPPLAASATTYTKSGLADKTHVKFRLAVVDNAGNESAGRTVEATTRIDNPTGVVAAPASGSVALSWNKALSSYLKQYNIYQLKSVTQQSGTATMVFVKSTTASTASITGLTNGDVYQFAVTSVNTSDAENISVASVSATPRSDAAGPNISSFDVKVDGLVVQQGTAVTKPAVVNIAASDTESQMGNIELYIDGNPAPVATQASGSLSYNWDIIQTTDGNHILKVVAYDTPGNSSVLQKTYIVSLAPPSVPVFTGHVLSSGTNPETATINGTASQGTTVTLFIDGVVTATAVTQNGQFQFSGVTLKEGSNALYANASHRGGESPLSVKYDIVVDTGAPSAPSGLTAKAVAGGSVHFTWSAGAGEVPASYNLYASSNSITSKGEAGVSKANTASIPYTLTDYKPQDDAMRFYAATAVDAAGNESGISNVVSVTSDRVAPYITGKSYRYVSSDGTATEQAQVAGTGKVQVAVEVNELLGETPFFSITPESGSPIVVALSKADDTHWNGEFTVNSLTPHGQTQFSFTGKDIVGNRGNANGAGIAIDVKGPSASVTEPAGLRKITDQPVTVNVEFDEPPVGLPVLKLVDSAGLSVNVSGLADSGDGLHFTGNVNVSGMAEGDAKFSLVSTADRFGNKGSTVSSGEHIILYTNTPPAPPVPDGLSAKSEKGGNITLSWNSVSGAVSYNLYRRAESGGDPSLVQGGLTGTSAVDVPQSDGKYLYAVSAVGQLSSESAKSVEVEGVSDRTPPAAPESITLSFGANGVTALWSAPQGEVPESYNLYRSGSTITADSVGTLIPAIEGVKVLTCSDPSPVSSLRYYAVTAVDIMGNEGQPSESKDITFPVAPVKDLNLIRVEGSAPVLSWEAPQTGVGYNIYRNGVKLNSSPVSQTAYTDSSYSSGSVKYGISAVDSDNNESPVKEVTYSGFEAGLATGVTLNRGYIESVPVLLNNPGDTEISVDSFSLKVGSGDSSALNGPFVVPSKSAVQTEKIGAVELDAQSPVPVSVTATWSPSPGVTVTVSSTRTAEVVGAGMTMDLFSDPLTRGGTAKVRLKLYNKGDADMDIVTSENGGPSSQVKVLLKDQDGNILAQSSLNQQFNGVINHGTTYAVARVSPGGNFLTDEITFDIPATAPYAVVLEADVSHTYYHYKETDQVTAPGVNQTLSTNMTEAAYRAAATVAEPFYAGSQPVLITGQAVSNTTDVPVSMVPVVIGVSVKGYDRYYTVNTDGQGNFSYVFEPSATEAGVYSVWANHPDVNNRSVQATFTIAGLDMSPSAATVKVVRGGYYDVPLTLENPGDTSLTGITYVVTPGDGVSGTVINPPASIEPGKTVSASLRVSASASAPDVSQLALEVRTAEGVKADLDGTIIMITSIPLISVTPNNYIDTGIVRGDQRVETLTLANTGAGTLLNARLEGPSTSWITLATNSAIGDVPPGGTTPIAVQFRPDASIPQKMYEDAVVVSSDNHIPFNIPIQCTVTTDSVGSALFDVLSSLNEHVNGASVRIQNSVLSDIIYTMTTDSNGQALFADVPAGNYVYSISASGCKSYSGSFEVLPGLVGLVPVGLEVNLIEYEFSVTPVLIEDRYEIVVTQTYQTDVPVPVLVVDPPSVTLPVMSSGEVFSGEFTVTNEGLIAADYVKLSFPSTFEDFTVECLGNVPTSIGAKQKITVLYKFTKK